VARLRATQLFGLLEKALSRVDKAFSRFKTRCTNHLQVQVLNWAKMRRNADKYVANWDIENRISVAVVTGGVAVVFIWNMRSEIDPEQVVLQRTIDTVRAEYPGSKVIQRSAMPAMNGAGGTAAIVVFSEAGQGRERRVYANYAVQCDQPKPGCVVRQEIVWDFDDPDFLARASARVASF
jgi:hypothetical protein